MDRFSLAINAVKLSPKEPFTWTSGIESPIYCDNRQVISHPDIRSLVVEGFVSLIREKFPDESDRPLAHA